MANILKTRRTYIHAITKIILLQIVDAYWVSWRQLAVWRINHSLINQFNWFWYLNYKSVLFHVLLQTSFTNKIISIVAFGPFLFASIKSITCFEKHLNIFHIIKNYSAFFMFFRIKTLIIFRKIKELPIKVLINIFMVWIWRIRISI